MDPKVVVAFLAAENRYQDLRPSMKAAVDKVMAANNQRMVHGNGPPPDLSEECHQFRDQLFLLGLEGPVRDIDLYQEVMRPLFLLLVERGLS